MIRNKVYNFFISEFKMVPTPQEQPTCQQKMEEDNKSNDRVVISGMSGLFPDSRHVKDLEDILYSKVNFSKNLTT